MTSELRPVRAPEGMDVEATVVRSWVIRSGNHVVASATQEGGTGFLAVSMPGHEFRLTRQQAEALAVLISGWKRTWD